MASERSQQTKDNRPSETKSITARRLPGSNEVIILKTTIEKKRSHARVDNHAQSTKSSNRRQP